MALAMENGTVTVDQDFARFGTKSYAINKINTVEVRERNPHGMVPVVMFGGMGALFLWMGVVASYAAFIGLGIVCLGVAFWAFRKTSIVEYQLFLRTSPSEAQAFVTRSESDVSELRASIESAIARQGRPSRS